VLNSSNLIAEWVLGSIQYLEFVTVFANFGHKKSDIFRQGIHQPFSCGQSGVLIRVLFSPRMDMQDHFADRLIAAVQAKNNPLMVGLDPRPDRLPFDFEPKSSLDATADAFEYFCKGIIDVVAPLVACVKPQSAFFEMLGPVGMSALWNVIQYAKSKDLLVVLDAKRGDIGSTAAAYASAFLGDRSTASVWGCDAVTVNPFLGDDSLSPFVECCKAT